MLMLYAILCKVVCMESGVPNITSLSFKRDTHWHTFTSLGNGATREDNETLRGSACSSLCCMGPFCIVMVRYNLDMIVFLKKEIFSISLTSTFQSKYWNATQVYESDPATPSVGIPTLPSRNAQSEDLLL